MTKTEAINSLKARIAHRRKEIADWNATPSGPMATIFGSNMEIGLENMEDILKEVEAAPDDATFSEYQLG